MPLIRVEYGYRPGEKIVQKGSFICPMCSRKRQFQRIKVQKKAFLGILSLRVGDIGEYVQCLSCLKPLPAHVLDSGLQLNTRLEDGPLPPVNLFEIWSEAYEGLECEALIVERGHTVEVVSIYLLNMARNMRDVGAKIRIQDYENAKSLLVNILKMGLEWQETSARYKWHLEESTPKQYKRILEHMDVAHIILSRLP